MKQTEIGLIPDDWEVKRLGEISNGFSYGVGAEAVAFNGIDRYIRITDIDDATNRFVPNPLCSPKFYSSSDIVQENDILFARTGASVGKTYIYDKKDGRLIFAGFLMKVHVIDEDGKFIFYQTLTDKYKSWVISESMRTGQPGLNLEQIKNFSIPLPPLPEQQRIAKALSDVDSLIFTTEKLLQKKKNIKQGTMQELLTGKKRLPDFAKSNNTKMTELGEIPEDWEVKTLNEFIDDFIVPMRDKPTDLTGPIPWCRIEDFDGKYLSESKTNQGVSLETIKKMNLKIFPLNTLLVSCSANLGKCAIVSKELITNQTFIGLVPNKTVNVEYLFYKMSFEESRLNEMATGTTISYLSREQFEKYEITTPPTKEEQSAIAKVLSSMDKEIETLNTKLEKYRNLKTAMMQQLLTGKIRLV